MSKINLNHLCTELTREEGLVNKTTVAQTSEKIGLLGARWRRLEEKGKAQQAFQEFLCIWQRAGKRSAHRKK